MKNFHIWNGGGRKSGKTDRKEGAETLPTIRRKGKLETIVADLKSMGMSISGISVSDDFDETIVPIDQDFPYKDLSVFNRSDKYRIYDKKGKPVRDFRHLAACRRWLDGYQDYAMFQLAYDEAEFKDINR